MCANVVMAAGSRRGLQHWIWQQIKPAVSKIKLPALGVDALRIKQGELSARMVGEPIPRRISNVDMTLRVANNYHDMVLDLIGRHLYPILHRVWSQVVLSRKFPNCNVSLMP